MIKETIKKFEEYNQLHISDYISGDSDDEKSIARTDYMIGNDVFEKNIRKWLLFFDTEEEKVVFLNLLRRYRYYTEPKMKRILRCLAEKVKEDSGLGNYNDIYFITFPSKKGIKSGGDSLRAYLSNIMMTKINSKNILLSTGEAVEKCISSAKVLVFLDDVSGTGSTLRRNILEIVEKYKLTDRKELKLYAALICANSKKTEEKIKELQSVYSINVIPIVHEYVDKCLSVQHFQNEKERQEVLEIVKKYEKAIETNKFEEDDEINPVCGFNNSQMLVSFGYNTPNNTLSVFWRPSKISIPLFWRNTLTIRPSIADLKKRKQRNNENAYYLGIIKKENQNK